MSRRHRVHIEPGTKRHYVDKHGHKRTLTCSHKLPYLVDWHIKQNPCEAHLWKDESSGAILQIPVRAWNNVKYIDQPKKNDGKRK